MIRTRNVLKFAYIAFPILLLTSFCYVGCSSIKFLRGPRKTPQPAVVGLKLQPGESCHYTAGGDGYNFDVIFHVTEKGEASFKRIVLKSPTARYSHEGGSWSVIGGNIGISMFDLKITLNPVVARVCAGEKCFLTTGKSGGSWVVERLPFPESPEG